MKFFKKLFKFKPLPSYKINKYPTENGYKYAAFYKVLGVWWAIEKNGTVGVSESSILEYGPFFSTSEEAGAALNLHATNGGAETIWVG